MGVDAIKESFVINEEYINKALKYFSDALFCEMGKELPELQLLRGKCMKVKVKTSIMVLFQLRGGLTLNMELIYFRAKKATPSNVLRKLLKWIATIRKAFKRFDV